MSTPTSCDNCNKVYTNRRDCRRFTNNLRKENVLIWKALQEVLLKANPDAKLTPMKANEEKRSLCEGCSNKLKTLYDAWHNFFPPAGTESYIRRKLDERINADESEYELGPAIPIVPGQVTVAMKSRSTQTSALEFLKTIQTPVLPAVFPSGQCTSKSSVKKKSILSDSKSITFIKKKQTSLLRNEMRRLAARTNSLHGSISKAEDIPKWEELNKEMKTHAPNLRQIFLNIGATPKATCINPAMGVAISVMANSINKFATKFQSSMAFVLARTRASKDVYEKMNHLGISTSYRTLLRLMDKISEKYDEKLQVWKSEIVEALDTAENQAETNEDGGPVIHTYSLTFDNLNRRINPSHSSSIRQTRNLDCVTVLAFKNRVGFNLSQLPKEIQPSAVTLDKFKLTTEDVGKLKFDMKHIMKKMLVSHLTVFNELRNTVKRITHKYATEMALKSEIINLGAINENENSIFGMVAIAMKLRHFAIIMRSGTIFKIILHGDGLSMRRFFEARTHAAVTPVQSSKLLEFEGGDGKFHNRARQLSIDMQHFFKNPSYTVSHGTLPQLRQVFGHLRVFKDTKTCFNATTRFFRFATTSYVLALACNKLGLSSIEDTGLLQNLTKEAMNELLEKTTEEMLHFIWHKVERSSFQVKYCVCQRTAEESDILGLSWIGCENMECKGHLWYHVECSKQQKFGKLVRLAESSDMEEPPHTDDNPIDPIEDLDEEIVLEFFDEDLPAIEAEVQKKTSKWFCSSSCETFMADKVSRYSRGLMFNGLMQEGYLDSIRQGDGERLIAHSKLHFLRYCKGNFPTYRAIMARYLAALGGAAPGQIQHDLKNNAVVNPSGFAGKNLETDLVNEFANKILSWYLSAGHGNITDAILERKSRCVGFLEEFRKLVSVELSRDEHLSNCPTDRVAFTVDLDSCVKQLLKDEVLVVKTEARHHEGFKQFSMDYVYCDDISKFKKIVQNHVQRLESVKQLETVVGNPQI